MEDLILIQRLNLVVAAVVLVFLVIPSSGWSTEVTGSLTFDGLPIGDTFPEMQYGGVRAVNRDTYELTLGSVDAGEGTYSIDLVEGTYDLRIVVGEEEDTDSYSVLPGNLWGGQRGVNVGSGGTETVDFEMYYMVHVTAPYDDDDFGASWGYTLPYECPYGPEVPDSFRLQWDPVPRVDRYEVRVEHFSCPDLVRTEVTETTETSVDIEISPAEAETVMVRVEGVGRAGYVLTRMPGMLYDNGITSTSAHWLHATGDGNRPIHSSNSSFLIQVARLAGVGSSYWTSDVTLTNTGPASVLATLTFTARGANGLVEYSTETFEVPSFSCRTIKDVVGTLFGMSAAGSLEISPASLRAYARTATNGDDGSYGQAFPVVTVDGGSWASQAGGEIVRAAGIIRGAFRTNLILAEIWGETAEARVRLLDMDGVELGVRTYSLPALGNTQINDLVKALTGNSGLEVEDAQVMVFVTSGGGRVAGALSIVDQGSDDPITVMLE